MIDWIHVCCNTIENISISLYVNNNKKSYQRISMLNEDTGERIQRDVIAPVDFHTVISTILYSTSLDEVITGFNDTWASNVLEEMINNIKN